MDTGEKTLKTLFETGLKDIYGAEKLLVDALPEVLQAVDHEELEEAISAHLEQTKKQVGRLEKIFERMGIDKNAASGNPIMETMIENARKIISDFSRGAVRDSALIIGAQKIEHYEIALYGSLCELADVLGDDRTHDLLGRSLDEEEETDEWLSDIAGDVNDEAAEVSRRQTEYQGYN